MKIEEIRGLCPFTFNTLEPPDPCYGDKCEAMCDNKCQLIFTHEEISIGVQKGLDDIKELLNEIRLILKSLNFD